MKSARFNAAKRFERMHAASILSLAVAGVVGFLVPVFPLIFATTISPHAERVLEFTSFVTGALSITLGLYDLGKNYPERARQYHECGKAINRVLRKLSDVEHGGSPLRQLVVEYEHAIDSCPDNHDPIDYEIARAQWDLKTLSGKEAAATKRDIRSLKRWEWLGACWLYALIWLTPLIVGCLLYFVAPSAGPS